MCKPVHFSQVLITCSFMIMILLILMLSVHLWLIDQIILGYLLIFLLVFLFMRYSLILFVPAVVAESGRLGHIERIAQRFAELTMAHKGEIKAIVTSVIVSSSSLLLTITIITILSELGLVSEDE